MMMIVFIIRVSTDLFKIKIEKVWEIEVIFREIFKIRFYIVKFNLNASVLHYKASKCFKFLCWGSCLDNNFIQQNKKG